MGLFFYNPFYNRLFNKGSVEALLWELESKKSTLEILPT